jgi:hypothetical protein
MGLSIPGVKKTLNKMTIHAYYFYYLPNKYLLNAYSVPDIILGIWKITLSSRAAYSNVTLECVTLHHTLLSITCTFEIGII